MSAGRSYRSSSVFVDPAVSKQAARQSNHRKSCPDSDITRTVIASFGSQKRESTVFAALELNDEQAYTPDTSSTDQGHEKSASDPMNEKEAAMNWQIHRILTPDTPRMEAWDQYMAVCLVFTALVTPPEISFTSTIPPSDEVRLNFLFFVNRLVDLSFLLDMGVNANLAFRDLYTQEMIYDRSQIVQRYLRGWFWVDLISVFPFEFVGSKNMKALRVIRLLRLVKLLRILRASRVFRRIESRITGVAHQTLELIKCGAILVLLIHWGACLWRLVPQIESSEENWMTEARLMVVDNDLPGFSLRMADGVSVARIYGATAYVAAQQISFGSPSSFGPVTTAEFYANVFGMVFGGSVFVYVIGQVCGIIANLDPASIDYHQTLDNMQRYLHEIRMPLADTRRMRLFMQECKDVFKAKWYQQMLTYLSPHLQAVVAMHCYQDALRGVWFFNSDKIQDDERWKFFSAMTMRMKPKAFCQEESLYHIGDRAHELFLLQKGLVMTQGKIFGTGRCVGEDMILSTGRRIHDAIAITHVGVYSLDSVDLWETLEQADHQQMYQLVRTAVARLSMRRAIHRVVINLRSMKAIHDGPENKVLMEYYGRFVKNDKLVNSPIKFMEWLHDVTNIEEYEKLTHFHQTTMLPKHITYMHGIESFKKLHAEAEKEKRDNDQTKMVMEVRTEMRVMNERMTKIEKMLTKLCNEAQSTTATVADTLVDIDI